MLNIIKHMVVAPVFDNEEQTRRANLLNVVLWIFVISAAVAGSISFQLSELDVRTAEGAFLPSVTIALILLGLGLRYLMYRGHVAFSGTVIVTMLWAVPTIWTWFLAGVSADRSVYIYPFVIALAGLLLGPRGAVIFTVLSGVGLWGAFSAEQNGSVPMILESVDELDVTIMLGVLAMTGLLMRYGSKNMLDSLMRARQSAEAHMVANRRLAAMQGTLEERIRDRTEDLTRQSQLLRTTAEIGRLATSVRDQNVLPAEVVTIVSERLECYCVGLFRMEATGEAVVLAAVNTEDSSLSTGYRLPLSEPMIISEVVAARAPRLAWAPSILRTAFGSERERISDYHPLLRGTDVEITLPLLIGDRLLGVLDLHSEHYTDFRIEDIDALQVMADQIAVAIENAELIAENQEALEAERRLYRRQSREGWASLLQSGFVPGFHYERATIEPIGDTWQPEMTAALEADDWVVGAETSEDREGAVVAAPIRVRGNTIGVLDLRKKPDGGVWTERELELLRALTTQLETALENARLYQDTQRRALREQISREITDRIRSALTVEEAMRRAVQELAEITEATELVARVGTEHMLLNREPEEGDD